ncbi:MAG: HEAT repeat domain-containing protein [Gemmatimonadota bacterium]
MNQSVIVARHLSYLVWLLMHEPASVDEQKATLRALVATSKDEKLHLALHGAAIHANDHLVPAALTGAADVASQMAMHSLALISIEASAPPGELLGVARILASMPTPGDGGAAAEAQRLALGITKIRFAARPRASSESTFRASSESMPMPEMEFGDVLDEPLAMARAATPARAMPAAPEPEKPRRGSGMFDQFAATRMPTESPEQLLSQLEGASDAGSVATLLDDLAMIAEHAAKEGKDRIVADILSGIGRREPAIVEFESKRAFIMALKRLAKPAVMKSVVAQLKREPERRGAYLAVLARAGDDGADALIEQLSSSSEQRDRRIFIDTLLELNAGRSAAVHMLADSRWYAVRNAAELLGEMQAREAEEPLTHLLHHEDERVRRAATGALMRLGTARAAAAIEEAVTSSAPQMRMDAAAALATRRDSQATKTLFKAIDSERDEVVQSAFFSALGKIGTPEAVERLIQCALPERGIFKKKSPELRVAAVRALAEAKTQEAMDALRSLQEDRETAVRESAALGLRRISRATTFTQQVAD